MTWSSYLDTWSSYMGSNLGVTTFLISLAGSGRDPA
jgi:hypothetical protein